jgi:proline racemase
MRQNAFREWRKECEAVQKEMDRLIKSGRPQSPEERQVRQLQFTALIERRDAAARNLLAAGPSTENRKPEGDT